MLERTKSRALPLINQTAEGAPMVTACCNACRTCMTTNALTLAFAGFSGLAVGLRRFARRPAKRL